MRNDDPFRLNVPPDAPLHRRVAIAAARPLLASVLRTHALRRLYEDAKKKATGHFATRVLDSLGVTVDLSRLEGLPASGPVIVAANHPHGVVDGLALTDAVLRKRIDVRVLTNRLLAAIPELASMCLFVDAFEGKDRAARSRAGLRAALDWLRDGHVLIVFPSGEVAHDLSAKTPVDSAWHATIGRLALSTGAAIVPAFLEGRNSRTFYAAGRLHPRLRTLLLARELLKQRGRRISIAFGTPAAATGLARDPVAATACVRDAVEQLRGAVDPLQLDMEVQRLRREHKLLENGALEVFCAPARHIPNVLQEIGRLRELTFRAVGEGTGRPIDLDWFDEHYLHLFVWNAQRREIAGAYRIGPTDTILVEHGVKGLYTSTLFKYDERLLSKLSPALELGRSFVRAEYQRNSSALLLLWKGIGRLVTRSMRYRVLFGPVSISSRYGDLSQQLLMNFLADNHYDAELGELVEALTPPTAKPLPAGVCPQAVSDVGEVDRMIARLEEDGKGVPVLVRQYLRLNARVLGFNVDPAFGDALDALMMVDLADVDPAILNRYFGREDAERFRRRHARAAA